MFCSVKRLLSMNTLSSSFYRLFMRSVSRVFCSFNIFISCSREHVFVLSGGAAGDAKFIPEVVELRRGDDERI